MRLHHLEMVAFGPFAERTRVDFDALSEAGLFLLSGATGAGKTSVLDAVCFALYGDVPGDRSAAKRLRCDQAAPDVAPRVVLEVTLGRRRFRVERSPAWERPKKRGAGLTTQQASVTMSERCDGAWTPLSSRLDETGDLVTRLVGMNLAQFTQVAMLPQGRFQTFLRAKSDERHQLLEELFRTGRFAEVERWLRERRVALVRADAEAHLRAADVVSRISEAAARPLPDTWDVRDLRQVADDGDLLPWAAALVDDVTRQLQRHQIEAGAAAADESAARTVLDAARDQVARRRRYDSARRERDALDERADDHAHDVRRLEAARRAAAVVPLVRQARSSTSAAAGAATRADASLAELAEHLGLLSAPSSDELPRLVESASASVVCARAALPRARRLTSARRELVSLGRRLHQAEVELEAVADDRTGLPERLETLRAEVGDAREAAQRRVDLVDREQVLRGRLESHGLVVRLRAEVQHARSEWLAAREVSLALKEELLVLRQARIEGMAAELAGALASGCSCPVCGSAEHPARAAAAPGAPDARAEKVARAGADDATVVEHAFAAKVHELETSLAAASARAGEQSAAEVRDALADLATLLRSTSVRADRLDSLLQELRETEESLTHRTDAHTTLTAARARLGGERDALEAEVAALETELEEVLEPTGHGDLSRLLADAAQTETLGRAAMVCLEQAAIAERQRLDVQRAIRTAAHEAGFDDAEQAAAAALGQESVDLLAEVVDEHRRRRDAVMLVLTEPGVDDLADDDAPDLDQVEACHADASARRDAAAAALHVTTIRRERLAGLADELALAAAPWIPLRDDLGLTTRLASFVEGKSSDNLLRMRLSAYVLAYRLSQVVAAANERLARMSDQRYCLEHTGHRGAGETRGGLSLLVRDDWSGETRDPATLSGGETFVVSLALALGLSDVVANESGGAALDTLFVDEGFGSLDADTLDDVMDTLDSLRDGGRVVGLVSHVAEMRDRIPTQLVVSKARGGSAVRHRASGTMDR